MDLGGHGEGRKVPVWFLFLSLTSLGVLWSLGGNVVHQNERRGRRKKKEEEEEEGTFKALKREHKDLSPAELGTLGLAHATDVWFQTF